jgi:hypothetical protein
MDATLFDLGGERRRRDGNREARVQAAIIQWIRAAAPNVLAFHPPNGGWRSKSAAARFRWLGAVAGLPDIVLIAPGGKVFFLEVKAPGGTLNADQRAIRDRLVALGTPPAIVRCIDDARRAFAAWRLETRETGA